MQQHSQKGKTLALVAALLGWMFDGMEMGLFPQVGKDALRDLLQSSSEHLAVLNSTVEDRAKYESIFTDLVNRWYGVIIAGFLVGAATGGVLFGWLGDKIGRVKAMTFSVLLYSLSSGLCGFCQEAWQLAALRFLGALGMGGEWALGVALVMEIWPNSSRAFLAALIGAFGNLGYTIVGLITYCLVSIGKDLPQHLTGFGLPPGWARFLTDYNNWRLLMIIGAIPALLTLLIRLFVPESEKWKEGEAKGKTSHWSSVDLLGVLVAAAAGAGMISLSVFNVSTEVRILGTLVGFVVVLLGYLYPIRGYVSRANLPVGEGRRVIGRMLLGAGLSGVALLGTWAGLMWMYMWVDKLPGKVPESKAFMQIASSIGAAAGCVASALLGGRFGRRIVYVGMCILSAIAIVCFYRLQSEYSLQFVLASGLLGFITASFYGWLPLYLPELFPTAVRATGQGFGFNCGRVIAAVGSLQMPAFLNYYKGDYGQACTIIAGVYVFGLVLIAFAPETKGKDLPE